MSNYAQTMADFRAAIATWIRYVVGHDRVFYAQTNFTRPKQQYVTYRIVNVTPDELPSYAGFNPDTGREIVDLNHHAVVQIICYKDDLSDPLVPRTPMAVMNDMVHSVNKKEIYYRYFSTENIGHLDSSTITDRSIVIDNNDWEQRAGVLMTFHFVIRDEDEGTTLTSDVGRVILEQTVNEGDREVVCDITVDSPDFVPPP